MHGNKMRGYDLTKISQQRFTVGRVDIMHEWCIFVVLVLHKIAYNF